MPAEPCPAAISPDGRLAAFAPREAPLTIVDLVSGNVRRCGSCGHAGYDWSLAFSPDSGMLAWTGEGDGIVRLFEVATGKERTHVQGHRGQVHSVAFADGGRILITGGADTTALVWDLTGPLSWSATPPGTLNAKALAACWDDLRGDDAGRAYTARRRLLAEPDIAVPFLAQRVQPVPTPKPQRVARLIADLDSDDFAVRDTAHREVVRLGDVILPPLRKAFAKPASLELRRRLEQLIALLEAPRGDALCSLRAVEALEYLATPAARRALQTLADGAAAARQTQEARKALARLKSLPSRER